MRARPGAVLFEAIVAIAILATSGLALMIAVSDAARAVARAEASEQELRRASAFLDVVSLWTRADLDRHLGTREQGDWTMRVDRPFSTLYVVSLLDHAATRALLRTSLYRAEEPDATR